MIEKLAEVVRGIVDELIPPALNGHVGWKRKDHGVEILVCGEPLGDDDTPEIERATIKVTEQGAMRFEDATWDATRRFDLDDPDDLEACEHLIISHILELLEEATGADGFTILGPVDEEGWRNGSDFRIKWDAGAMIQEPL